MGRGDKRTKKGKVAARSYGKKRARSGREKLLAAKSMAKKKSPKKKA